MRKSFCALTLLALLTITISSCSDDTIGSAIVDIKSSIIEDSSFVLIGNSQRVDRIQMRSSVKMLGSLHADGFGDVFSEAVTQWMPAATIDTSGVDVVNIDSCRLKLRIPNTGGFTGDSLVPMRLNVYRLNKQLPSPIYSDFDPTDYYNPDDLLGTVTYSPRSMLKEVDATTYTDTTRVVSVPMPDSLARNIYKLYKTNPDVLIDPTEYAKVDPGIYIANDYGTGRVLDVQYIELDTYYSKYVSLSDTTDTVYPCVRQSYLASTPEVVSNNIISLNVDDAVVERVGNGEAIIMAPAGYDVNVKFPIQDIIDTYRLNTQGTLARINSLELEIPVDLVENEYNIAPPSYLLMVKSSMKDKFIAGDSLTNSKDSFYATYNASKKKYTFSGMRDYILDIFQNKDTVPGAEDIYFTFTPVDVTTYTSTSSYSYYYSTSSTSTITKLSPQVSKPAICRLRLDKAKVKIVYSGQTVK